MRRTNHTSMSEGISSILDPNTSNPVVIEGMATNLEARMAAIRSDGHNSAVKKEENGLKRVFPVMSAI